MAHGFINERPSHYLNVKDQLLRSRGVHAVAKFDSLNGHLDRSLVMPGQLVIVPDDRTAACTLEESWLMRRAREIEMALQIDPQAGIDVLNDYDLLQGLLGYSSIGIGSTTAAWANHLKGIEGTLAQIEALHRKHLGGSASARREFIADRQALFRKLDNQLRGLGQYGSSLRHNQSIKKMLGISTQRYLHRQEIAGYAQRIDRIARTAAFLKKGGYVGMALDVAAAGVAIHKACTLGREEQCRKARYVEGVKAAGGIAGAYAGGKLGALAAVGGCVAVLGIATGGPGALACAVVGGAAGGLTLGVVGGMGGELLGEVIYEGTTP